MTEMKALSHHDMDHSGLCMKELVTWCQHDIVEARKAGHIDSRYQEKFLHDKVLAVSHSSYILILLSLFDPTLTRTLRPVSSSDGWNV